MGRRVMILREDNNWNVINSYCLGETLSEIRLGGNSVNYFDVLLSTLINHMGSFTSICHHHSMMNGFTGTEAVEVLVEGLVRWVKSNCGMHKKSKRTWESVK